MANDVPFKGLDVGQLLDSIQDYCATKLQLPAKARVLVAVSGGADSVALTHALHALGHPIEIAHFDHRTRNGASTRDAAFVHALAEQLQAPYHLGGADVSAGATAAGTSFEMHARTLRYDFLLATARARDTAYIATGHHADDQAETVLLRVLRGTSGRGIAGIPPVRNEGDVRIVRPLLGTRRATLLAYLNALGADYCVDCSNTDTRHARNRVRHELIPLLEATYNPQAVDALNRLAENERIDHAFLESAGAEAMRRVVAGDALDRGTFRDLHEAIRRRVIQAFAWDKGVACNYRGIADGSCFVANGRTGACFDLGGGCQLVNGASTTELVHVPMADDTQVILCIPGTTDALGRRFTVRYLEQWPETIKTLCGPSQQVFDSDTIRTLHVRRWQPADRFVPLGMSGSRKLSDYLSELKLAPSARARQLVLVADVGIVWVIGHASAAVSAVGPSTRRVLYVEVSDAVP